MSEINLCAQYCLAIRGLTAGQRAAITNEALGWLLRDLEEAPNERQGALMEYVRQRVADMHAGKEPPR